MYQIKKLEISLEKEVGEVNFGGELNIIEGSSNTGKSTIYNCIDYLLGGESAPFPKEKKGTLKLFLNTNHGPVTLIRDLGSKEIHVRSANHPYLREGTYIVGDKKNMPSGQALLGLLDIQSPVKIFESRKAAIRTLSLRDIIGISMMHESKIASTENFLFQQAGQLVSTKSALLYLQTGQNYITGKEQDEKWFTAQRALLRHMNASLKEMEDNNSWLLLGDLATADKDARVDSTEKSIYAISEAYEKIQAKYLEANTKSQEISTRIVNLHNQIAVVQNEIQRDKSLNTKYRSDLKRMGFLYSGGKLIQDVKKEKECPVCHHELKDDINQDFGESVEMEANKLLTEILDLDASQHDVEEELANLEKQLQEANEQSSEIQTMLKTEIKPLKSNIEAQMAAFKEAVIEQNKRDLIREEYEKSKKARDDLKKEIDSAVSSFNPDDYLAPLSDLVTQEIRRNLSFCQFPGADMASFDAKTLDIQIGGSPISTNGKGYRGLLNTIMGISLHNVLFPTKDHIHSMPLIIDSPTNALNEMEKEGDNAIVEKDQMKRQLMKLLVQCSQKYQVIVIENEVPDIGYPDSTVKTQYYKQNGKIFGLLKDR